MHPRVLLSTSKSVLYTHSEKFYRFFKERRYQLRQRRRLETPMREPPLHDSDVERAEKMAHRERGGMWNMQRLKSRLNAVYVGSILAISVVCLSQSVLLVGHASLYSGIGFPRTKGAYVLSGVSLKWWGNEDAQVESDADIESKEPKSLADEGGEYNTAVFAAHEDRRRSNGWESAHGGWFRKEVSHPGTMAGDLGKEEAVGETHAKQARLDANVEGPVNLPAAAGDLSAAGNGPPGIGMPPSGVAADRESGTLANGRGVDLESTSAVLQTPINREKLNDMKISEQVNVTGGKISDFGMLNATSSSGDISRIAQRELDRAPQERTGDALFGQDVTEKAKKEESTSTNTENKSQSFNTQPQHGTSHDDETPAERAMRVEDEKALREEVEKHSQAKEAKESAASFAEPTRQGAAHLQTLEPVMSEEGEKMRRDVVSTAKPSVQDAAGPPLQMDRISANKSNPAVLANNTAQSRREPPTWPSGQRPVMFITQSRAGTGHANLLLVEDIRMAEDLNVEVVLPPPKKRFLLEDVPESAYLWDYDLLKKATKAHIHLSRPSSQCPDGVEFVYSCGAKLANGTPISSKKIFGSDLGVLDLSRLEGNIPYSVRKETWPLGQAVMIRNSTPFVPSRGTTYSMGLEEELRSRVRQNPTRKLCFWFDCADRRVFGSTGPSSIRGSRLLSHLVAHPRIRSKVATWPLSELMVVHLRWLEYCNHEFAESSMSVCFVHKSAERVGMYYAPVDTVVQTIQEKMKSTGCQYVYVTYSPYVPKAIREYMGRRFAYVNVKTASPGTLYYSGEALNVFELDLASRAKMFIAYSTSSWSRIVLVRRATEGRDSMSTSAGPHCTLSPLNKGQLGGDKTCGEFEAIPIPRYSLLQKPDTYRGIERE